MKQFRFSKTFSYYTLIGFFAIIAIFIFPSVLALDEDNFEYLKSNLENELKNNPKNLKILQDLSSLYNQAGMCDKAINYYDRILELKPKNPKTIHAKANCLNELGLPDEALSTLSLIDNRWANDHAILIAKGNSHVRLLEYDKAEQYYQTVLKNDPDNRSATNNMIIVANGKNDLAMAETYLVKRLGNNPSPSDLNPDWGNMPYAMQLNDSKNYSVSVQVQIRNASDELIAIVESEKILFVPHPLMYEIIDQPKLLTETIQNESGTFEIRKIVVRDKPKLNDYFMDRVTLSFEGHLIFFAYNMAIPLEDGDNTVVEWTIKKKID